MDSGDGRGKVVVVRGVCEGRSLAGGGTRGSALFAAPDVAGACWLREGWFEAAGRLALADMRGQHASRLAPAMCREKKSTGSARQKMELPERMPCGCWQTTTTVAVELLRLTVARC